MKIILLSCVSKKRSVKSPAKDLYISPLFKYSLKYAELQSPDKIFILSSKYGLVDSEDMLEPYDETLNHMNSSEIKLWSDNILRSLAEKTNLEKDTFIIIAGNNYRKHLIPKLTHYELPTANIGGIGKILHFLKTSTSL